MRIGMLINGYYPRIGGAERILTTLAPVLQSMDVEVHVLTKRHPGLAAFERIDGVPVHRLPIPGPKVIASPSFTLTALPLIKQLAIDILHVHELGATARTAVIAKRWWGIPMMATIHRSGPLGPINILRQKVFGARHLAYYLRHIDSFVVISREIEAELKSLGIPEERRTFIPNGVDTRHFKPPSHGLKQELRTELALPEAPVVVFTGRLDPEKRVNHLINIWPMVRQAFPEATLLVLGGGSEEGALRQLAGEGVRFEGSVDDVVPYLQASDLFVLPSEAEGMSVAALEALATGLPVVMTDVGGARDMIDNGQNGLLIPFDDPDSLQQAILMLLEDDTLRARLGMAARRRVERDYSLPEIAQQLRAVYIRLLENKSINWQQPQNLIS